MNADLFKRVLSRSKKDRDIYYSIIQISFEEHSDQDKANALDDRMRAMFSSFVRALGLKPGWLPHEEEVIVLELLISDLEK